MKAGENTEGDPGPLQLPEDVLLPLKTATACSDQFNHEYFLMDLAHFYPLLSYWSG